MENKFRHFKALMRKNWINMKRTPIGTAIELLTPALLMIFLVIARKAMKVQHVDNFDVKTLQHPRFPIVNLNSTANTWTINQGAMQSFMQDESFQAMMRYANYTNTNNNMYNPLLDMRGPLLFNPPHCTKHSIVGFDSPIVAYIKGTSPLQKDMISQLKAVFANQRSMADQLKTQNQSKSQESEKQNDFFKGTSTDVSDSQKLQDWSFELKEFESREALNSYISDINFGTPQRPGVCFGFAINERAQNDIELELMFNDWELSQEFQSIPVQRTAAAPAYQFTPRVEDYQRWEWYGFGYMVNWVANTILKRRTGVKDAKIVQMSVPMKVPSISKDPFAALLGVCLPVLSVIMFLPSVYRTTYRITKEKEMRTKESMYMMGLNPLPYWLSWFAYHVIVTTILVLCSLGFMAPIFPNSSLFVVFMIYYSYGISLFGLIMTVQALFTQARVAAIVASTSYLLLTMPFMLMQGAAEKPPDVLWGINLLPPSSIGMTTNCIVQFETNRIRIDLSSWDLSFKGWSVRNGYCMLTLCIPIWLLLGIYLEAVAPREYGKPLKPWFMFLPSFWCPKKPEVKLDKQRKAWYVASVDETSSNVNLVSGISALQKNQAAFETKYMNADFYEPVPAEVSKQELNKTHLQIKDLFKEYKNGFKAVNGINLKMYKDQIFVLLGHNGAGKTTTISMLTGLFQATKGEASVFGVDMFNETEELRKFMGVCPQHEVLFELLTPQEHLDIFYDFKGANPDPEVKWSEINKLLIDVGVDDKRHHITSQLSGGNQRKVSVCVALCGNSKFVLLDEPSSGLDLSARRQMWNMLKEHKKDRIIILTTHYMDEADILGDRIAIMSGGKITCLGTPMFLKHKFGVGYTMTIVKTTNMKNKTVLPFLRRNLGPDVKKLTEVHQEMTFQIPNKYSDKFKLFFKIFDFQLAALQIQSYGVSITTLEEVFLKVGHLADPSKAIQECDEKDDNSFDPYNPVRRYSHDVQERIQEMKDFEKKLDDMLLKKKKKEEKQASVGLLVPPRQETDTSMMLDTKVDVTQDNLLLGRPSEQNILTIKQEQMHPFLGIESENDEPEISSDSSSEEDSEMKMRRVVSEINVSKFENLFEPERKREVKYSLKTANLDRSFTYHLKAVFFMRWGMQKRSYKSIVNELLIPALIAFAGLAVTKVEFDFNQQPSKLVVPDLLPSPIRLVVNQDVIDIKNSDTKAQQVWSNLPDENQFKLFYVENYGRNLTYDQYQDALTSYVTDNVNSYPYLYGAFEAFKLNRKQQQYQFFTYLNLTCKDGGMLFPQFFYESILKLANNDSDFKFTVRNSPYPMTDKIIRLKIGTDSAAVVFFITLAVSVLSSMIVGYIVTERVNQLKHMQTMTGLRVDAYWLGNFIVDWTKFIPMTLVFTAVQHFMVGSFDNSIYTMLAYPFGNIPFLYVTSFLFSNESAAQTFTMFFNVLLGSITPGIIFVLRLNPNLCNVGDVLNWILRSIPTYCIGNSVFFEANGNGLSMYREGGNFGRKVQINPLYWENNIADTFCTLIMGVFWIIVLFAIENGLLDRVNDLYDQKAQSKIPSANDGFEKDEDVRIEENRVRKKADDQLEIKVSDFRKCYMIGRGPCNTGRPFVAVEKLSFGLSVGECFCLLGVNGAGKSTTFKSLTCEVKPTSGQIKIAGHDIQKDWSKVRQLIGYCPQTNPIFETMTVEEHIDYYARIKGIASDEKEALIEEAIKELGLEMHRKKEAGTLSGGNKRKLSVAIAIIGNPQIILLDEPSAGMDPESRRFMWQVVAKISNEKTSAVILTTHLMEEAEALSTKMGIMVKGGVFKCFGSSQHIKNKFGTGYVIDVKIRKPTSEEIQQIIDEELPQNFERDIHGSKLVNLKQAHTVLSRLYSKYIIDYVFQDIHPMQTAAMSKAKLRSTKLQAGYVSAQDLAISLFTQNACIASIEELCQVFGEVELLEKYGGFMSMRVAKQQKTIGFVFGYLDEIRTHCDISEYSVSQTTLEQIFQGFANLQFNEQTTSFCLDNETGDLVKL